METKRWIFAAAVVVTVPGNIFINEVAWMGSPVEGVDPKQGWRYEWVELRNEGEESVNLAGWTLEGSREERDFEIALEGIAEPREYFVIGASSDIAGVDFSYDNLGGKLVNSGQLLVLRNAGGEIVDKIDAREGWFAGDNEAKLTMSRIGEAPISSDPSSWVTGGTPGGTPGAQNDIPVRREKNENAPVSGDDANFFSLFSITAPLAALMSLATPLLFRRALSRED